MNWLITCKPAYGDDIIDLPKTPQNDAQSHLKYIRCTQAVCYLFVIHDRSFSSPFLQQLLEKYWLVVVIFQSLYTFGYSGKQPGELWVLMELVDPETGIAQVADLLAHQPVVLLCVCADVERCHRRLAAEAITARYGVSVTHL